MTARIHYITPGTLLGFSDIRPKFPNLGPMLNSNEAIPQQVTSNGLKSVGDLVNAWSRRGSTSTIKLAQTLPLLATLTISIEDRNLFKHSSSLKMS